MPKGFPTMRTCCTFLTFVHRPPIHAQASRRNPGKPILDQSPPLLPTHSTRYTPACSSSCYHMTRCLLSVRATSASIALSQGTSQRIAVATIAARSVRSHIAHRIEAGCWQQPVERVEPSTLAVAPMVSSHAQPGSGSALLMKCQILVHAPDGSCY